MLEQRLQCPSCRASLRVPAAIAPGKSVRCPKCSTTIRVPTVAVGHAGAAENAPRSTHNNAANPAIATPAPVQPPLPAPAVATAKATSAPADPSPAATRLTLALRSTSGLLVGCGMFLVVQALLTLNGDHDWYGRGPNVIVKDEQRRDAFQGMFLTVLGAGLGLVVVGGLVQVRQRWLVYLGFPVAIAATLVCLAALFAANAHILWFVAAAGGGFFVCFDLVWVLISHREARNEAEFQQLRSEGDAGENDGAGEFEKLIRLLRHPKSAIRMEAIRELSRWKTAAAPAVPELIAALLRSVPADPSQKGICAVCGATLSIWTRDRVKSPEHPKGFPACLGCRNRLVNGQPSEAQFIVEALGAIGPAAITASPVLKQVARSYDPLLKTACGTALQRLGQKVTAGGQ